MEKPPISPIHINRDEQSAFFRQIASTAVPPIEPEFVDFGNIMDICSLPGQPKYLVVQNENLPVFSLNINFPLGSASDRRFPYAASYLRALGTGTYSPAEISDQFYQLACSFNLMVRQDNIRLSLRGLNENMEQALALVESLIWDTQPDEEILAGRMQQAIRSRNANKNNQQILLSMMENYAVYGPQNPSTLDLSDQQIGELQSEELLELIRSLWQYEQEITYHGAYSLQQVKDIMQRQRRLPARLLPAPEVLPLTPLETSHSKVFFVHFDANQSYLQTVSRGIAYEPQTQPLINLYNRYFGSGMQSIVFQELREKRALAYSATASYREPSQPGGYYIHHSSIATQNDKVPEAFRAFEELFDQMPLSPGLFELARERLLSNLRTERLSGELILLAYQQAQRMGRSDDERRRLFSAYQQISLDDIHAFSQQHIREKPRVYLILGHREQIDFQAIEQEFGPVTELDINALFPR